MQLTAEIELLSKVYNTLSLISTKGQETLYMANCLNAIYELQKKLAEKNITEETVTLPIDDISGQGE